MSGNNSEFNMPRIAAVGLAIAIASGFVVFGVVSMASSIAHSSKFVDVEAANARIAPVAKVDVAAAGGAAGAERTGEQLYSTACMACHGTGAAGAPKVGDKAGWAPRLAQGLDGLVKSAIKGKGAMPPKGGSDASDIELARAIVHMVNNSGGNLKEPAAK